MLCSVWTFECTLLKSTSPGILQARRKEHHCKQLQMFWRGWRKSRNLGSIPRVREIYFLVDFISKRTLGNPFWNPFLHRFLVDWNITFRAVLINILIVVMGDVTSTKYLVTGWETHRNHWESHNPSPADMIEFAALLQKYKKEKLIFRWN